MPRLDRGIQAAMPLAEGLDCPVKPGNDGGMAGVAGAMIRRHAVFSSWRQMSLIGQSPHFGLRATQV
jgi:hypothetical protein